MKKQSKENRKKAARQTTLPLPFEHSGLIYLELKPYIQPFERVLARAELAGLLEEATIVGRFDREFRHNMFISTKAPVSLLKNRLAYWEKVGRQTIEPTLQVLFESSTGFGNQNNNSVINKNNHGLPTRRRLRYGVHDIHEYRGKFFPQLVKALINASGTPERGVVLDPMCGSGTTNCEARSMGMTTLGLDINPLSVMIASIKTTLLDWNGRSLEKQTENLIKRIGNAEEIELDKLWEQKDLKYLRLWFAETALVEIGLVLKAIRKCRNKIMKDFAQACLSNILRRASWQKDTDLRVRKHITPYTEGAVLTAFSEEITRQLEKIVPYLSILRKSTGTLPEFEIREGDVRQIDRIFKSWVGKCDVLITSPPYAMALPYLDTDRLSLIILGLLQRSKHGQKEKLLIGSREISDKQRRELWEIYQMRRSELPKEICNLIDWIAERNLSSNVGFRRRNLPSLLARYFLDMKDSMERALIMMKPGKYAFYVVGNNSTRVNGERVEIPTHEFLWRIGKMVGWKQEKIINMELLPSRDIFRENRGSSETILVFKSSD